MSPRHTKKVTSLIKETFSPKGTENCDIIQNCLFLQNAGFDNIFLCAYAVSSGSQLTNYSQEHLCLFLQDFVN